MGLHGFTCTFRVIAGFVLVIFGMFCVHAQGASGPSIREPLKNFGADSGVQRTIDFLDRLESIQDDSVNNLALEDIRLFGPDRFDHPEFEPKAENFSNLIEAFAGLGRSFSPEYRPESENGDGAKKLFGSYISLVVVSFPTLPLEKESESVPDLRLWISQDRNPGPKTDFSLDSYKFFFAREKEVSSLEPKVFDSGGYIAIIRTTCRIE